jgi:dipeptidyl aminopeptidase/acylaminoacyl peptidase
VRIYRWLILVIIALLGFGAYTFDRMALSYLTGQRRVPGRDYWGAPVRMEGPVPGFAFLGRLAASENLPGLKVVRAREDGRELGLETGDVILSVDGKVFTSGRELHRELISSYNAGDVVTFSVGREGESTRELLLTLEPFLRHPGDLGLPYIDVEIMSRSGFMLRGWFIPPPERSDGRAAVFVHGAKSSRFQALEHGAKFWQRRGYGLLAMDLSGRGTSDGAYVTYTVNERLDIASMLQWLRSRDEVDESKVVLFGTSNGASSAIYAAAEDAKVSALALDAPYSDLWKASGEELKARGYLPLFRYPLALAVALRTGIDLRAIRPGEVIARIKAPVLFLHGDADRRVLPYHSEFMADARQKARLPTERWVLPGGEHGFDNYPPEGIVWSRILDFFDRALGGPPPDLGL